MRRGKYYYVYIITNYQNTTLYTGVTNNIIRRVYEHKKGLYKNSFTSKYKLTKLVYYETYDYVNSALEREKQIKAGPRKKKEDLINSINIDWKDLFHDLSC